MQAASSSSSSHSLRFRTILQNCIETFPSVGCQVTGSFPPWLNGVLYRAGPGTFEIERSGREPLKIQHWFDGLALIHRFQILNGQVTYSSKHTAKGVQRIAEKQGSFEGLTLFAQDPCQSIFRKMITMFVPMSIGDSSDPSGVNIPVNLTSSFPGESSNGKIVAMTDANMVQELDPETMEPQRAYSYTSINPLFAGYMSAAHPQVDPSTGEFFNYTLNFGRTVDFNIFRMSRDNPKGELLSKITAAPSYIHSMYLTNRYLVLGHTPFTLGWYGAEILYRKNVLQALHWNPNSPSLFYVLDREDKKLVATYKTDPFFFFHTINAFEQVSGPPDQPKRDLILDVLAYKDAQVMDKFYLNNILDDTKEMPKPQYRRYVLQDIGSATQQAASSPKMLFTAAYAAPVQDLSAEMPRINPAFALKDYNYFYAISRSGEPGIVFDQLVKVDVKNHTVARWQQPNCTISEPVFVAHPGSAQEDGGVVLSIVFDEAATKSFLVCLDAVTMTEIGRAEVHRPVPFGFHGDFVATPAAL